ncbi:MAG: cobalt-precorrin-5B (C(1))-methyltransferase, partial [Synechococcaceae bacterium WB7_3xG_012]|nr:cobalt-precorrin-5B (C(1))-methyltransferase [Synechococcaceae bacterium WB7_3xG_012]
LAERDSALATGLQQRLAAVIEQRARAYLAKHHDAAPQLGAVLFDRSRSICACGPVGAALLEGFRA